MRTPESNSVLQLVMEQSRRVLETYRIDRGLIQEHANSERRITQGGYGDRQIYELVQNGADELLAQPGGRVSVILTEGHLYCANQGSPMAPEGADTILRMGVSRKRGGQIGRFGVGVKSVLSVTDTPQFFSREQGRSFGFSREWAEQEIRSVWADIEEIPVLRMARPLEPGQEMQDDPVLAELLDWATTVVRLPLKPGKATRLGKDLDAFPVEFPLFSPHVGSVVLEDRRGTAPRIRHISQQIDGDTRVLQIRSGVGNSTTETVDRWRVFTRRHRPSPHAIGEAGELHDRPEIDVSWAVPERKGRGQLGQFWAFFPTNFTTTLRGILNAPWKTSEDRQNLYDGNEFNRELIRVSARLVVESLEKLSHSDDPCTYLDFVPARGREEPQFAATDLVDAIWKHAAVSPTLPDQDGRFGLPEAVRLHPARLQKKWLDLWAQYPGRPTDWCHHSVENTAHRRQSAERILASAKLETASIVDWLEALVADHAPESSRTAIRIVADIRRHHSPFAEEGHTSLAEEALKARIVLTEDHQLVAPSPNVFRRSSDSDNLTDRMTYVDERVITDGEVQRALDELGIHEADAAGRFASVLTKGFSDYDDARWTALWELSRKAGPADTLAAIRSAEIDTYRQFRVRTVAGRFRPIRNCLLPGPVVPRDGSRDAHVAVDLDFHGPDRVILGDLGLLDGPVEKVRPQSGEGWYDAYVKTIWERYCRSLPSSERRPKLDSMHFEGAPPAGPLHFLTELSEEGSASFLQALPRLGLVTSWTLRVGRSSSTVKAVVSPLRWMAHRHGHLRTSRGLRALSDSVGPQLRVHHDVLPVSEVPSAVAEALKLPDTLEAIGTRFWKKLVEEAALSEDDVFPGKVYALLVEAGADWPEGLPTRCRVGAGWSSEYEDADIAVTSDRAEYESLIRESLPALLVPDAETAEVMRRDWGMASPDDVIQKEIRHVAQSEPNLILEEFPHLRLSHRAQVDGWSIVRCGELQQIVRTPKGMNTTELESAVLNRSVLVLDPDDDLSVLNAIDVELGLGLGPNRCRQILDQREKKKKNERLERARKAPNVADKLLELADVEAIKAGLPQGLLESENIEQNGEAAHREIAQLAVDSYGVSVMRHYRKDIEANVPDVACGFNGDNRSLQVVNQLGLPQNYAGTKEPRLPATETVDGPREFPRLHDYQEKLAAKMFDRLTRYKAGKAMLCLPTGAGKTRVAAEAVIRVIKAQGLGGRPVLWIAQTSELCEQAVQSWQFVWSKVGPDSPLTISRLRESNEAAPVSENPHLVVATDAKLEKCLHTAEYAWLRDAALVLIDEAHTSITPRYTELLKLLGITHRSSERPLIGLTATPFRGFNEEETQRLVQRYGGIRLDEGIFDGDPYTELQNLGVLAHVEHRELTGVTIELSETELEDLEKSSFLRRLPISAEKRIADDHSRNTMLIEEIRDLPDDEPVLLFATSVNHAKLLAARLNKHGIRAEAVDSTTPLSERRRIIEDYRNRKIRVLTNYGVLAQGFDAPATKTVIVARPTYSPNVYQQMIGRGLRGKLNGGKEICRILDVHDNVTNYDKKLAFTEFEHLWGRK
ncbi:DEAD/DEAH box helicase [Nocardiopsis tropica]|uniref:DEAD/DEAH box helicase n=1 Tax=Nocardiopsis tropica TaxID=109330 RepID=A0ABV2A2L1_9ACTN